MANKTLISPAFEKGHFDDLVDEGRYLRQSSLYKQILPRTLSWQKFCAFVSSWLYLLILAYLSSRSVKICVNPRLMNYLCAYKAPFCAFLWLKNPRLNISSCSSCLRGEKIREISVNPWLNFKFSSCLGVLVANFLAKKFDIH